MKKSKVIIAVMAAATMMVIGTACGKESTEATTSAATESAAKETQSVEKTETMQAEESEIETQAEKDASKKDTAEEKQMTGVLEERKDFMIIVTSDEDQGSYVLNIEDGSSVGQETVKAGDKVTVTYTGDASMDGAGAIIKKIEKIK